MPAEGVIELLRRNFNTIVDQIFNSNLTLVNMTFERIEGLGHDSRWILSLLIFLWGTATSWRFRPVT
jgi:hypothetical protein